jgi:hypothetical protein
MHITRRTSIVLGVAAATAVGAIPAAASSSATVTVTESDLAGWTIAPFPTADAVAYSFDGTNGSDGTSGSLAFGPIGGSPANKFIAISPYTGHAAQFGSMSYDYYLPAGETRDEQSYVNLYVEIPPVEAGYDCRYDFVPTGGVEGWNEVTITADSTWTSVTRRDPGCADTIGGLRPGSRIVDVRLNGGDTGPNDAALSGAFDDVEFVSATGNSVVYDFEAAD